MHWTERRTAKANLGLGLQARGWKLYGFKEDQSDMMTDYYDPASWDGIAEKNGYVVVVDAKTNRRSGGYKTTRSVPDDDCPHCAGSGQEPNGWTYERAKAAPREFNRDHTSRQTPGAVSLFPDVVSPLHFDEHGREKCVKCHGQGHKWKQEEVTVSWPEYQVNPPRKLWHVERGGRILASGIGLGPCANHDREKAQAAVERIITRIEDAIYSGNNNTTTTATTRVPVDAVTIRRNLEKNGIEVIFPAKPDAETRRRLGSKKRGGLGFRWSRRQELWYARYSDTLWKQVHDLLGVTENQPEQHNTSPEAPPTATPRQVGPNRLDEMLTRVAEQRPVVKVQVIESPGIQRRNERRRAELREKSRTSPAVLMTLKASTPEGINTRMGNRGWWWNGTSYAWQHHDPDEGWLTIWYLKLGDHVAGVWDVEPSLMETNELTQASGEPGTAEPPNPLLDRAIDILTTPTPGAEIDVNGIIFDVDPIGDSPLYSHKDARDWLWMVAQRIGSGDLAGKRWWTIDLWEGDQPHPLNSCETGKAAHKGPLFDLTDDEEEAPPMQLLAATARLIALDYTPAVDNRPESVTIDSIVWTKHHYKGCSDAGWKTEGPDFSCTIRGDYSNFNEGKAPFWHAVYVDTSDPDNPIPHGLNGDKAPLVGIDDEGYDPPLDLMAEITKMIHADFACIHSDPSPEILTRAEAQAILDETTSPANNPAQTLTVDMLDALERVSTARIIPDDQVLVTADEPNAGETLDVGGITFLVSQNQSGMPLYIHGADERQWIVSRVVGHGSHEGQAWWEARVIDALSPTSLNAKTDGSEPQIDPLFMFTDDDEAAPPMCLLRPMAELIKLNYPHDIMIDGIVWRCIPDKRDGNVVYRAERDPWWVWWLRSNVMLPDKWAWRLHWHKPGDLSTSRCLTDEPHGPFQNLTDPREVLTAATECIRRRGGPPPKIEVKVARIHHTPTGIVAVDRDTGETYVPPETPPNPVQLALF